MYWVPSVVRLDSAAGVSPFRRNRPGFRRLARLDLSGAEVNPDRRATSDWHVDSLTDSVHIHLNSGYSGTEFAFALGDTARDTLFGRATGWGDVNNFRVDYGRTTAVRVGCPERVVDRSGWTPAQLELLAQRSADSSCASWRVAGEQPVRNRGTLRVDSLSGTSCLQAHRAAPFWFEGRWWCPGAVGYDSAFRAIAGKYNRIETRMDRPGIDESQCPGWHSRAVLYRMAPPAGGGK
jgi:hypothetical protein